MTKPLVVLTLLTCGCVVLNVEVKGRTEQLIAGEVNEYQKMKRWEPVPIEQRCHYWAVLAEEVSGPTPTAIVGVTTSGSPRIQAVVKDERDRACAPLTQLIAPPVG